MESMGKHLSRDTSFLTGQLITHGAQNYEGSLLIICVPFLLSSVS